MTQPSTSVVNTQPDTIPATLLFTPRLLRSSSCGARSVTMTGKGVVVVIFTPKMKPTWRDFIQNYLLLLPSKGSINFVLLHEHLHVINEQICRTIRIHAIKQNLTAFPCYPVRTAKCKNVKNKTKRLSDARRDTWRHERILYKFEKKV